MALHLPPFGIMIRKANSMINKNRLSQRAFVGRISPLWGKKYQFQDYSKAILTNTYLVLDKQFTLGIFFNWVNHNVFKDVHAYLCGGYYIICANAFVILYEGAKGTYTGQSIWFKEAANGAQVVVVYENKERGNGGEVWEECGGWTWLVERRTRTHWPMTIMNTEIAFQSRVS